MELKTQNRERLRDLVGNILDAENFTSNCFRRLSSLIKNGRVRNQFYTFSDVANQNNEVLKERFKDLDLKEYELPERCRFCQLKVESFSLIGAIDLGLEVKDNVIKSYKELLHISEDKKDKTTFKRMLNENVRQRNFLKRERRITQEKKEENYITSICAVEIVSQIWK